MQQHTLALERAQPDRREEWFQHELTFTSYQNGFALEPYL
jgi:hypothetical protein